MRYDLLALDLDGTTLDREGLIRPTTRDAIAAARARGVEVVLVTGRHHVATRPFHTELGLDTPAICCNGTYVYDFAQDAVVTGTPMPRERAQSLLALCRRHDVHTLVYTETAMTFEVENDHMRRLKAWAASVEGPIKPEIVHVADLERVVELAPIIWKFVVSHSDKAALDRWIAAAEAGGGLSIEYSWQNRIDVVAAGNTKGRRLIEWAAARGVPAERIVAVGDNHNDLTMIEGAGLGIAVGNAEDEVKAVADLVVAANDQDGVVEAIERVLLV